MSLPPVTVQIKRKATDEPVDFLRVHESNGKRQRRTAEFVFSRQATPQVITSSTPSSQASQTVRRIKQLPRGGAPPSLVLQATQPVTKKSQDGAEEANDRAKQIAPPTDPTLTQTPITSASQTPTKSKDVRRFHMSRSLTSLPSKSPVLRGRVQKRSTLFVERRSRPSSSQGITPAKTPQATTPTQAPEKSRPQKKPGLAARIPTNRAPGSPTPATPATPAASARLPSSLTARWDFTSEDLAAEMQAYTLQEIGLNLARSEAENPKVPDERRKAPPSRFKPKAPALRYHQRHPEEFVNASTMDVEVPMLDDEEMNDDSDYIIDTYIRMPAHEVEGDDEKNFGLLVLDSQPDIDDFYREDSDNEEQENDEEEDENAEDHYTADYPDDEVDSDDEYDRNAYNYRNHNASDLEEFDEYDEAFSDDEGDDARYPWDKIPALPKAKKEHSDDEEY